MLITLLRNCQPVFQSGCRISYSISRAGGFVVFCFLASSCLLLIVAIMLGEKYCLMIGFSYLIMMLNTCHELSADFLIFLPVNVAFLLQLYTPFYQWGLLFYSQVTCMLHIALFESKPDVLEGCELIGCRTLRNSNEGGQPLRTLLFLCLYFCNCSRSRDFNLQ